VQEKKMSKLDIIERLKRNSREWQQRIEELEHENRMLLGVTRCPGYHITTEQIDAAWAKKVFIPSACLDDSKNTYIPITALGIERCEGCWDCADGGGPEGGPRCNGKGWTVG
jgi:hypothetical protein